jgi:hypothetical protein
MSDPGKKMRMKLLEQSVEEDFVRLLRAHLWDASITRREDDGEYIVVEARRADVTHKFAVVYSTAIGNGEYKKMEQEVEVIFAKDGLYHVQEYAYGISTPIKDKSDFFSVLVEWNKALRTGRNVVGDLPQPAAVKRTAIVLQSENPLEQVWGQLRNLGSIALAKRLIAQRCRESGVSLEPSQIQAKAEGLAYAVRNAADYFRAQQYGNPSQRVLSYYYGCLALAFAEMLAAPGGAVTLGEIEDMTKQGHGLYTVDGAIQGFDSLIVAPFAQGFFPKWVKFLGHDTAGYPKKKAKSVTEISPSEREMHVGVADLFARIPEVYALFGDIFESPPLWWRPEHDGDANASGFGSKRLSKTYIKLVDESGRSKLESLNALPGPISEIQPVPSDGPGIAFRAVVDHPGHDYWFEVLRIHRGPFVNSALIAPIFGGVDEFRVLVFVLLYSLSIVVRYRPSLWRRVQEGDWDHFKVLTENFLDVVERIVPEEFLERIAGMKVVTRQPGAFF